MMMNRDVVALEFANDHADDNEFYLSIKWEAGAAAGGAFLNLFSDGSGILVPWGDDFGALDGCSVRKRSNLTNISGEECMTVFTISDAISFCCLRLAGELVL